MTITMEQYFIQYLGEDETSLTPIEPECELTENDIDNEEGVFYVNGEECLTMPERCNFEDDPQPGDLVFECFDGYALYRRGMNNPTGGEDCIIGTMDEIRGFDQSDWQNESVKPKKVRITEGMIRRIIRESLYEIAKVPRGGSFLTTVQNLIAQANDAFNEAKAKCEDNTPLMDREGDSYGLAGPIVLTKTGVVKYTLVSPYERTPDVHNVKVMSIRRNGDVVPVQGDYWEEGWKDVRKTLNAIIKDAQRGMAYFSGYDPAIEELPAKQGKQAMRDFNKSVGLNRNVGTDIF